VRARAAHAVDRQRGFEPARLERGRGALCDLLEQAEERSLFIA
jgi:hypothetical protein